MANSHSRVSPSNNNNYYITCAAAIDDEVRLREAFSNFGAVTDVFLPLEKDISRSRGFGFVTFANPDAASLAISNMDQSQFGGKSITVQPVSGTLAVKNDEEFAKFLGGVSIASGGVLPSIRDSPYFGLLLTGTSEPLATDQYRYTNLNSPHFIKRMVTGSATTGVGLFLVSAKKGDFETAIAKADMDTGSEEGPLLRDIRLLYSLGVDRMIVRINMSSYSYGCSEDRFSEIKDEFVKMLQLIGFKPKKVPFIPYSGFNVDNLVENSDECLWYEGWTAETSSNTNTLINGFTVVEALNKFIQPPKQVIGLSEGTTQLMLSDPAPPVRLPISNIYNIKPGAQTQILLGPEAMSMCNGGKLGLVSCGDSASQWYATGGQFISSHCYALGFSSILSADEGCNDLFVSMATPDDAITRAQTFLAVDKKFIETIPPPAPTDAPTYFPTS